MPVDPHLFHPGICEATAFGKRYGKNLESKNFDDPEHQWHLAKEKNWGPWSCCGKPVNARGCQRRETITEPPCASVIPVTDECYLQFLDASNVCRVIAEEPKCWRLDNGRVAKKKTQDIKWKWVEK